MPHKHAPAHGVPDHDPATDVTELWKPDRHEQAAIELLTDQPCTGPVRTTRAERAVIGRVARALEAGELTTSNIDTRESA